MLPPLELKTDILGVIGVGDGSAVGVGSGVGDGSSPHPSTNIPVINAVANDAKTHLPHIRICTSLRYSVRRLVYRIDRHDIDRVRRTP